jgi:hypothetical protein
MLKSAKRIKSLLEPMDQLHMTLLLGRTTRNAGASLSAAIPRSIPAGSPAFTVKSKKIFSRPGMIRQRKDSSVRL